MVGKVHIALVANERYRLGLECTKASMLQACATPDRLVLRDESKSIKSRKEV